MTTAGKTTKYPVTHLALLYMKKYKSVLSSPSKIAAAAVSASELIHKETGLGLFTAVCTFAVNSLTFARVVHFFGNFQSFPAVYHPGVNDVCVTDVF